MARRKQLKGIAQNLAQWSLSRNFDFEGYWAIGKLFLHCKENDQTEIEIIVLEEWESPKPTKFSSLANILLEVVKTDLKANLIPYSWVRRISATYKFEQEYCGKYHFYGAMIGKPFICNVEITTDLDRTYRGESGANCWVHNPKKESRRACF